VLKKYENLPDADRVVRCVGWTKLRRDGEDNDRVIGFLGIAFQRNPDHDGLSVNWLEHFPDEETRVRDCVWAFRSARTVGPKAAFAIGMVGKIKETAAAHGAKVRIIYDPQEGEPAHSEVRQLPRDDMILLDALAQDAFTEMVLNSEIGPQPAG
jgi:hypothetical protein